MTTGAADFVVDSETFQTWYTVVGNLKSGIPPLVVLHGGPGFPHHYMHCHTRLLMSKGIPVVLYDQLGCGQSTHLPDKPKNFWTVQLFTAELDNLLEKLGIREFDLLGHSWGGALAASYVLEYQPRGLKRLVLASAYPSMRTWEAGCRTLIAKLPADVRDTIDRCEREGTTDSEEYKEAQHFYLQRYCVTVDPLPVDVQRTIEDSEKDETVYQAMNGPSEWYITGSLKSFDIIVRLKEIQQPTLVINGAEDEATDMCVGPFFWNMPSSKWVQFSKSTHMAFHEEPDRYFEVVGTFLTS